MYLSDFNMMLDNNLIDCFSEILLDKNKINEMYEIQNNQLNCQDYNEITRQEDNEITRQEFNEITRQDNEITREEYNEIIRNEDSIYYNNYQKNKEKLKEKIIYNQNNIIYGKENQRFAERNRRDHIVKNSTSSNPRRIFKNIK